MFTSFFVAEVFADRLDPARVHTWPLQGRVDPQRFRSLLPLYPAWFSALDLRRYELVISSSSAFAPSSTDVSSASVSAAFDSVMRLSFEVQAGLLFRQVHHWTAVIFVGTTSGDASGQVQCRRVERMPSRALRGQPLGPEALLYLAFGFGCLGAAAFYALVREPGVRPAAVAG